MEMEVDDDNSHLDAFIAIHKPQLEQAIPKRYWASLYHKLKYAIFDANRTFERVIIQYDDIEEGRKPLMSLKTIRPVGREPEHIYLLDHIWTFRIEQAKADLLKTAHLRKTMCELVGISNTGPKEDVTEQIFSELWTVCNTYFIENAAETEDRLPIYYIMDDVGTSITHSEVPNCRIVPFIYVNDMFTYSVLFPIELLDKGEHLFRNYAEGLSDDMRIKAALIPWEPYTFNCKFKPDHPGPQYYIDGHVPEYLPNLANFIQIKKYKYKVFAECGLVNQYLSDTRFELVSNESDADILWYTHHFQDYTTLSDSPNKFVNQFPYEYVITMKDLLSLTCRKAAENQKVDSLPWYPITYNLTTEIGNFMTYFQYRERQGLDNIWIMKPYNLARGLDIHITDNINYIVKLPFTGHKIAQKYITEPVLYFRPECEGLVKFDIRYVVVVQSFKPLRAYAYRNFFLRFANKPFELNEFHLYEKHFTVMNYSEPNNLKHMPCADFMVEWQKQYPDFDWNRLEASIMGVFKQIFEAASSSEPPCGVPVSPQSRALYGVDLMLEWTETREMQPKILEINWTPDCKRACDYYPNFYNDVFKLLFLEEESPIFTKL